MLQIVPFDPTADSALLLQLWGQTFGPDWPVDPAWLQQVTNVSTWQPGDHLLAVKDGRAAGFALTQAGDGAAPGGSILAMGVLPEYRRRGVGRALHSAAVERLRQRGVAQVQLGAGALQYFWPGVPVDLPDAWPFFHALGWPETERSYDLTRSLVDYRTPGWVWERVGILSVEFGTAAGVDPEAVLAFVTAEQRGWAGIYAAYLAAGRSGDILLARVRGSGEIVGACVLENDARRWAACFTGPLAAPGCFLTAEKWQGQGIGMALVALANETLQKQGCKTCFIGWTWLVDWYGKLGFRVWQENVMSARMIREISSTVATTV